VGQNSSIVANTFIYPFATIHCWFEFMPVTLTFDVDLTSIQNCVANDTQM